jgi:hypothetical protein
MEKLSQGPIADALTHVGQIAMLRRMAGAPVNGKSYFAAENRGRSRRAGAGCGQKGIRLREAWQGRRSDSRRDAGATLAGIE